MGVGYSAHQKREVEGGLEGGLMEELVDQGAEEWNDRTFGQRVLVQLEEMVVVVLWVA